MNFVMVLSTGGPITEALGSAVEFAAQKKARLDVVFVLESRVSSAIFDKLTDIGFIGEKPGEELEVAVGREYRRQAEATLAEVARMGAEVGIEVTTEIVEGEFLEASLEAVARYAADTLIVVRMRQSFLSKLLPGGGANDLLRLAPCEIKVFEA